MESIPKQFQVINSALGFPLFIDADRHTSPATCSLNADKTPRSGSQLIINSKCTSPWPFSWLYSMLGAQSLHSMLIRTPPDKQKTFSYEYAYLNHMGRGKMGKGCDKLMRKLINVQLKTLVCYKCTTAPS